MAKKPAVGVNAPEILDKLEGVAEAFTPDEEAAFAAEQAGEALPPPAPETPPEPTPTPAAEAA